MRSERHFTQSSSLSSSPSASQNGDTLTAAASCTNRAVGLLDSSAPISTTPNANQNQNQNAPPASNVRAGATENGAAAATPAPVTAATGAGAEALSSEQLERELLDKRLRIRCICLAALAELAFNNRNSRLLVQANAIYAVGSLLFSYSCRSATSSPNASFSRSSSSSASSSTATAASAGPSSSSGVSDTGSLCNTLTQNAGDDLLLQQYKKQQRELVALLHTCAFRALRILYCQERNRRVFKALLPVSMFELFVNIGKTELELREPRSYRDLVIQFANLPVR